MDNDVQILLRLAKQLKDSEISYSYELERVAKRLDDLIREDKKRQLRELGDKAQEQIRHDPNFSEERLVKDLIICNRDFRVNEIEKEARRQFLLAGINNSKNINDLKPILRRIINEE